MLELFFKRFYGANSVGYVVENVKPTSWQPYTIKHNLFIPPSRNQFNCILSEGIRVWKEKIQPFIQNDTNCIIHAYDKDDHGSSVFFINKKLLLQTVKDNIHLFQYALRPTITPEDFLEGLCQRRSSFGENDSAIQVLDPVLLGIILGYGVENALCGGYSQKISIDLSLPDVIPYILL